MSEQKFEQKEQKASTEGSAEGAIITWIPDHDEIMAQKIVMEDYIKGNNIIQKSYNYLNHRSILDCIDEWTKRWNGYIPDASVYQDTTESQIFLQYTRQAIIAYLVKVAMNLAKPRIIAVNKKNNIESKTFAQFLKDANEYSLNAENGDSKFFASALETAIKGTCITYEGYMRQEQEMETPVKFDQTTGTIKTKKETRVIYDDCYQKIVPLEDFLIANPYEPDIQKQPFVLVRQITTYTEAKSEFGHYSNFEFVKAGNYTLTAEPTTFYRNSLITDLNQDQVEILKWFNRSKNRHIVLINGIVIYDGVIPFRDGKYPFAKAIQEPFGNDFFWGMGFPEKIMGEQDLKNLFFNMSVDKAIGALLPFGLTSDLDDLIEDDVLACNKIRKVGDINKWKFDTLPGLSQGDVQMMQLIDRELGSNSSDAAGGGASSSPRGGKLAARQVLMQQQESMQKLGFSTSFLEDYERDRTELRIGHILQFYSIPKLEKITGLQGSDMNKLVYRDMTLNNIKLSNGHIGNKVIKLTGKLDKEKRAKMADNLSVIETMGEEKGVPTEAIAIDTSTFSDYNFDVQIITNSTYQKNQTLEKSQRVEFANWRLGIAQAAPVNAPELVKWVEEAYEDIEAERFEGTPGPQQAMNAQAGGNPPPQPGQSSGGKNGQPQGQRPGEELTRTNNESALAKATQ